MGVTPTPNQAVHTLTATATESGWCLVGGVGNQRTGGQQTQQRAQGKQGGPHTHTASWSSDRLFLLRPVQFPDPQSFQALKKGLFLATRFWDDASCSTGNWNAAHPHFHEGSLSL